MFNYPHIRQLLHDLSSRFIAGQVKAQAIYKPKDVRITVFSKAILLTNASHVGITLLEAGWPHKNHLFGGGPDVDLWVDQYEVMLRMIHMQGLFSGLESSLRAFMRDYHRSCPEKRCKNGRGGFAAISACLLRELALHRWFDFLKLYRLTRNTIHNNGVFWPDDPIPQDDQVLFERTTYDFKVGKPIDFGTWDFNCLLGTRMAELAEEIVRHPSIVSARYVEDPGVELPE